MCAVGEGGPGLTCFSCSADRLPYVLIAFRAAWASATDRAPARTLKPHTASSLQQQQPHTHTHTHTHQGSGSRV